MPEPGTDDPALWRFSLAVYDRPGVAAACLDLQDRCGLDVNLLLFAAWAGAACGRRLSVPELEAARAMTAPWQSEVVAPLRRVRRRLKAPLPEALPAPAVQSLRARLQAAELEAERIAQTALARACRFDVPERLEAGAGRAAAAANLQTYLALCGVDPAAERAALDAILAGCGDPAAPSG